MRIPLTHKGEREKYMNDPKQQKKTKKNKLKYCKVNNLN